MIDLHSHILPGIDDGAPDLETSLEMARMAVDGGTIAIACTPHIMPPIYQNTRSTIEESMREFAKALDANGINLKLVIGADIHTRPDLLDALRSGACPTLNNTRYFLFEPSHNVMQPNIVAFCKDLLKHGYVPVLTHPERLTWIERHYDEICQLDELGVAIQVTGDSVMGRFGKRAKFWADRLLDEGRVDILASDAHNTRGRTTNLSSVRSHIIETYGTDVAERLLRNNPYRILKDETLPEKQRSIVEQTKSGIMSKIYHIFDR